MWDAESVRRFERARELGKPAVLRLRAEYLLQRADAGQFPLSEQDREELERISAAPQLDDNDFLGSFDRYLER